MNPHDIDTDSRGILRLELQLVPLASGRDVEVAIVVEVADGDTFDQGDVLVRLAAGNEEDAGTNEEEPR